MRFRFADASSLTATHLFVRAANVDQPALGQLGSLAQAARQKQLKSARGILLAIGILSVIANIGFGLFAQNLVDREFDRELANIRSQGMEVDELQVEELRAAAVRATQISAVLWTAIGVVFIVLGIIVVILYLAGALAGNLGNF